MSDYRMSEEERGKAFPIHVDMGDDGPVLDLGSRAAALNLPESGCALVDFVRNEDGTLSVKTVCLATPGSDSDDGDEDDEPASLDEAFNKVKDDYAEDLAEEDE